MVQLQLQLQLEPLVLVLVLVLVPVLAFAQLQRLVLVRAPPQRHAAARVRSPAARGVEWA